MKFNMLIFIFLLAMNNRSLVTCGFMDLIHLSWSHMFGNDNETRPPDPHELVDKSKRPPATYPTDQNMDYPSRKVGKYGFVVQLSDGLEPRFALHRGEEIYYFSKVGRDFIFSELLIAVTNSKEKFPPNISAIFKGKDNSSYFFIRDDAVCRRPLDVSRIGYDPPDYCPAEGQYMLADLLGCNIQTYPPLMDKLCNENAVDYAFLAPDEKAVWLLNGKDAWLLHNLPTKVNASANHCNLTYLGDITKRWNKFHPNADEFFVIHDDSINPMVVQFYRHRFTVWWFKGGHPISEGFIKEVPIDNSHKAKASDKNKKVTLRLMDYEDPREEEEEDDLDNFFKSLTTTPPTKYPTNRDKTYPSNKLDEFGYVLRFTKDGQHSFARVRGDKVFYFNKLGKDMIFTNLIIPVQNDHKRLPPNMTAVWKGPDGLFYFIRNNTYCRRPFLVSGLDVKPPDYCSERGYLKDLIGCNVNNYSRGINSLCDNPSVDHSFTAPDRKTIWLFRDKSAWLLGKLPISPKVKSPKGKIIEFKVDVTRIWKKFKSDGDAFFTIKEKNRTEVVQFYRHKFMIWNFKGGDPICEGFIKEMPLELSKIKSRKRVNSKPITANASKKKVRQPPKTNTGQLKTNKQGLKLKVTDRNVFTNRSRNGQDKLTNSTNFKNPKLVNGKSKNHPRSLRMKQ